MAKHVLIFMMVLAAFAAGTVAHATTMSMKMTIAAIDGANMGDCQDCPDGKDTMPKCENVCVSPIIAVVPSPQLGLPETETTTRSLASHKVTARTGPPDPYPPRSITLS
jgi:hypothetical protein